jgi:hypothetical protein
VSALIKNYGGAIIDGIVIATIDGYLDTVPTWRMPYDTTKLVQFQDWQVPSSDSTFYTMTICTEISQDSDSTNDCKSKNIFAYSKYHDAGVETLNSPMDTVLTDSTYPVISTVKNYGTLMGFFDVDVSIDSYSDNQNVFFLPPGNDSLIYFAPWTVPSMDSTIYMMTVCTNRPGDVDSTNNCKSKSIFAYTIIHDGGVLSLDSPGDTLFTDSTYSVIATVKNFGSLSESFDVVATIDGYADTITLLNLPPGADTQITFAPWSVPSNDSALYILSVCTYVPGDEDVTNNCALKPVFAYTPIHDGGVVSLNSPGDTVFTDSTYSVSATIKNFGSLSETFEVVASIDGYADTFVLVNLNPGADTQLVFTPWLVPPPDSTSYMMTVCTFVPGDGDTTNDCESKPIFSYKLFHDIGIQNFGSLTTDSIQIISTIDGYADTQLVLSLMPGDTALVSFQNWTVPSTDSSIYLFTVCTEFMEDADTTNDCAQKPIFAYTPVGIEEYLLIDLPNFFSLNQSTPNPFSRITTIRYDIPQRDRYVSVHLAIYDIMGRHVETLVNESQVAGAYQVEWDGKDHSSGLYFYRLTTDEFTATKKLILLR